MLRGTLETYKRAALPVVMVAYRSMSNSERAYEARRSAVESVKETKHTVNAVPMVNSCPCATYT